MDVETIKKTRVLYFGICDMGFSRNKIYIDGLRQNGLEVKVLSDNSRGLIKFWKLFWAHWKIRNDYDVMIVAYTCYILVPFAKLITSKPVIFDALCSFYESEIISRDAFKGNPFRIPYVRIIDWLATRMADYVLVETDHQRQYFIDSLGVRSSKLVTVYTGLDDCAFYFDAGVSKSARFTVLFRGRIMIEAGITHVLQAAKLLEDVGIDFLIIGYGWGEAMKRLKATLSELKPKNVRHIDKQLPIDELRSLMLACHVSLGQFEDNERLSRTIPHKSFESMAMRLPYVTARAAGIEEILKDGETCLFAEAADPADLAEKIMQLNNDPELAEKLAANAFDLYQKRFTPKIIVGPIVDLIEKIFR